MFQLSGGGVNFFALVQVTRDKAVGASSAIRLDSFIFQPTVIGLDTALGSRKGPEAAELCNLYICICIHIYI